MSHIELAERFSLTQLHATALCHLAAKLAHGRGPAGDLLSYSAVASRACKPGAPALPLALQLQQLSAESLAVVVATMVEFSKRRSAAHGRLEVPQGEIEAVMPRVQRALEEQGA